MLTCRLLGHLGWASSTNKAVTGRLCFSTAAHSHTSPANPCQNRVPSPYRSETTLLDRLDTALAIPQGGVVRIAKGASVQVLKIARPQDFRLESSKKIDSDPLDGLFGESAILTMLFKYNQCPTGSPSSSFLADRGCFEQHRE